jgi:parallel beta-helix repeat protein
LSGNNVANNTNGIGLDHSSSNTLFGNNVANNTNGIVLYYSSNNVLSGNNVTASKIYGIYFYFTNNNVNNVFYHNNFINNTQQVYIENSGYANSWDDGYPFGGNYWSDYAGSDYNYGLNQDLMGSDSVGDTAYTIDASNADHYPLMGPFGTFNAFTWNNVSYNVDIVCKSDITSFSFNPDAMSYPTLSFDVEGQSGTSGFCRVVIPKQMMWCDSLDQWMITVGGNLTAADTIIEDGNCTYIYFTYTHSAKTVQIQSTHAVPEFQPFLILPLLMIAILLAAIFRRRKRDVQGHNHLGGTAS